jgi:hypothetical protein
LRWTQWISILLGGLILGSLSMIRLSGKRRSEETDEAYYVRNKAKLLRDHRRLTAIGQAIMATRYEPDFVAAVTCESLAEFEKSSSQHSRFERLGPMQFANASQPA